MGALFRIVERGCLWCKFELKRFSKRLNSHLLLNQLQEVSELMDVRRRCAESGADLEDMGDIEAIAILVDGELSPTT